ncbi:MAG: sugar ABC transporter ATP-binding protein, partial [Ignavibacteria bacterium]|nr:sugar ABC transporter ATP-binding protein [Ignavibacteria bacterium]
MQLLSLQSISKSYPGVLALDNVNFELQFGEVHCLVGENGAGKSTLMKILSGAITKDSGKIYIEENLVEIKNPIDAQKLGIGMIYQDFKLIPELTVAENILLGNEPSLSLFGILDKKKMLDEVIRLLSELGEEIDPRLKVKHLSTAKRQIVEIAKAVSRKVKILALDEPSAPLTDKELENLFELIRKLKKENVGIIYISHRLDEIFEIGDRETVLRDGKWINTSPIDTIDKKTLIKYMVGRDLESEFPEVNLVKGKELLRVENLSSEQVSNVTFNLHSGEILGFAGLVGAGRSELVRLIFGADKKTSGSIFLEGKKIEIDSPTKAIDSGIGLLSEDRNRLGLILQMKTKENISLSNL